MAKPQRLELTWIGKDRQPKLEPRILIEDPQKSYGAHPPFEGGTQGGCPNMLIYGDNLLALKALEQDFAGKIKCIYIDPPFNTGAAFEYFEDGLEHSVWLNLMLERLKILHELLSNEGVIFVHLDDNELDYCKIMLDEIFQRDNFINRISIDARSPSAFSTVNPGVFKASEYILWYAKDKNNWESRSLRIPTKRSEAYNKFVINRDQQIEKWEFKPLKIAFLEHLNKDRLTIINDFLRIAFEQLQRKNNKEISHFLKSNFLLAQLVNLNQTSNYLYNKLTIKNWEEFYQKCYNYFLEKCSYFYTETDVDQFVFENACCVFRETEISDSGAGKEIVDLKYLSLTNPGKVYKLERENNLDTVYICNGKQISFYDKNVAMVNGKLTATQFLTNIWTDISWEGIAKEGGVKFKKGKKPEKLIQRVLELSTNPGDWVLDSFLGSGTTAAVAHKMGRKWIGIELGEHCHTHCLPRLQKVVDGADQGGISKAVNWQGGGGFKYYYLAPSLLKKDRYGNWVIDERYNPDMLAAAMAKHEGFKYQPDEEVYWKQGQSTEKDFIYTTTQFVTVELLDKIHEEMKADESLLITCKAFQEACERRHANITVKKIPNMLLGRCEFGKEDYSLNIVNLPVDEDIPLYPPSKGDSPVPPFEGGPGGMSESRRRNKSQLNLFSGEKDREKS